MTLDTDMTIFVNVYEPINALLNSPKSPKSEFSELHIRYIVSKVYDKFKNDHYGFMFIINDEDEVLITDEGKVQGLVLIHLCIIFNITACLDLKSEKLKY